MKWWLCDDCTDIACTCTLTPKVHLSILSKYLYKLSADRKCLKTGQSILCLLSRHGYRYGIMDTTCSMNEYWMPFKVRSFPNRVVHDLLLSNSSCSSTKKDIFCVVVAGKHMRFGLLLVYLWNLKKTQPLIILV